MLKRRPPGGGATPNRTQMWLFEGVKVDEIGRTFHWIIQTRRQTFSRGNHPPGPLAPWASMQKPCVRVERLLGSVKEQKESDGVTLWQVNKTHRRQSGNLDLDCHLLPLLMTAIQTVFSHYCCVWSGLRSSGVRAAFSHYYWVWSGLPSPSLALANDDRNSQDLDCFLSHLCDQVTKRQRGEIIGTRFLECRWWILFTCQIVTPLVSFCCFTEPSNLSTFESRKISADFILFYPFKQSYFSSVWRAPPPPGGLLLSILAPKWAALTLTQCTHHCVPVSQLHVPHQNSTSTCFSTV